MHATLRSSALVAALAVPALAFSGIGTAWAGTSTLTAKGGTGKFTFTLTLPPDSNVASTCDLTYRNEYNGSAGGLAGTPNQDNPLRWTGTVTGLNGAFYTVTAQCIFDDGPATTRVFVLGAF